MASAQPQLWRVAQSAREKRVQCLDGVVASVSCLTKRLSHVNPCRGSIARSRTDVPFVSTAFAWSSHQANARTKGVRRCGSGSRTLRSQPTRCGAIERLRRASDRHRKPPRRRVEPPGSSRCSLLLPRRTRWRKAIWL